MSEQFKDRKSLSLLTGIVALLAIPTFGSWFRPIGTAQQLASMNAARSFASTEAPTELPEKTSKKAKLSRPATVEWNLNGKDIQKEIDGTHLRLRGLLQGMKPESILNSSNGFTASVFETETQFTTDFIELQPGTNQIEVQILSPNGKKSTRKLLIDRRSPASK